MKKIIFLLVNACGWCMCLYAQRSTENQSVLNILTQVHTAYSQQQNLSFDMFFVYTSADSSNIILDSLSGQMQLSNNRYHWNIGTTEMIADSQYAVILFKDDKMMYLTKPSQNSMPINPIEKLDSSLLAIPGLQTITRSEKELTTVELNFPKENAYKKIIFTLERKTYLLKDIDMVVKTELLQNGNTFKAEQLKTDSSYAHVKVKYFNYSTESIDDSVFNMDSYFKKINRDFSPVPAYADYKIFIGSPNL